MATGRQNGDRDRQGGATPPSSPSERKAFADRLNAARKARAETDKDVAPSPYGKAMRLGSDFVAGFIVGGLLGFGIDQMFGTSPWGLIIFLTLGFVGGTRNAVRTANEMNNPADDPPTDN